MLTVPALRSHRGVTIDPGLSTILGGMEGLQYLLLVKMVQKKYPTTKIYQKIPVKKGCMKLKRAIRLHTEKTQSEFFNNLAHFHASSLNSLPHFSHHASPITKTNTAKLGDLVHIPAHRNGNRRRTGNGNKGFVMPSGSEIFHLNLVAVLVRIPKKKSSGSC